ncbi:alpha/beta hydrolase [Blastococcus sp. TF02A-30]|nr:alpha/beta hydrolase [Blastococcus sp. TF02A-30]
MVSLALVLLGGGVAAAVQSDNGNVEVTDVRFTGSGGQTLSALMYVPDGVTAENPAPAILAVHGYINSRETQDAFAIEFARRGYVVMALDQSGHGFSGGAAYENGYGGPAALSYLRSLDIVDPDNIGLEGHSMGGWTVLTAAAVLPDAYRSIVLVGSSTGSGVSPEGDAEFPRNMALVYGQHEEFSTLMWNEADADDVQSNEKMMSVFGTDEPVETGRVYGSIDDGTARVVYRPDATHPGLTLDPTAVRHSIDWFDQTLEGGHSASGQIWWLKEAGTLVAFLGGILFLFPFGALLLRTRFFAGLAGSPAPGVGMRGLPWWGTALLTAVVSAVTYFPFQIWGSEWVTPNGLFPQEITTGVMFWALGNALISLVLFAVWHVTGGRRAGGGARAYGLAGQGGFSWRVVGRSAVFAAVVTGALYGLLAFSDWAFQTDFRFYVFQLHLMDAARFRVFLTYLVPFTVFTLVIATVLHAQLRSAESRWSTGRRMLANGVALAVGVLVLIVLDYAPLIAGGTLWIDTQPLLAIVAYQFVPLLFVVGLIATYFADKTGTVYAGAFISSILITWNNVAGTANQVEVGTWGGGTQLVRVWLPIAAAVVLAVVAVLRSRTREAGTDHAPVADGGTRSDGEPALAGDGAAR